MKGKPKTYEVMIKVVIMQAHTYVICSRVYAFVASTFPAMALYCALRLSNPSYMVLVASQLHLTSEIGATIVVMDFRGFT